MGHLSCSWAASIGLHPNALALGWGQCREGEGVLCLHPEPGCLIDCLLALSTLLTLTLTLTLYPAHSYSHSHSLLCSLSYCGLSYDLHSPVLRCLPPSSHQQATRPSSCGTFRMAAACARLRATAQVCCGHAGSHQAPRCVVGGGTRVWGPRCKCAAGMLGHIRHPGGWVGGWVNIFFNPRFSAPTAAMPSLPPYPPRSSAPTAALPPLPPPPQILSTGADCLLKLWHATTGECASTFDEHSDKVWALTTGGENESMVATGRWLAGSPRHTGSHHDGRDR